MRPNLIRSYQQEKEEVPGKPGIKNPETGDVVRPPVDSVTKYGPVKGDWIL